MVEEAKKETAAQAQPVAIANCAGCGKQLKKIKRYYRNQKYYCSKKCFKTGKNKGKGEKQ